MHMLMHTLQAWHSMIIIGDRCAQHAYAHAYTLFHGGKTVAVLKTSLDSKKGAKNNFGLPNKVADVRAAVQEKGLIVSQYPIGVPYARFDKSTWLRTVIALSNMLHPIIIPGGSKVDAVFQCDLQNKAIVMDENEIFEYDWSRERFDAGQNLWCPGVLGLAPCRTRIRRDAGLPFGFHSTDAESTPSQDGWPRPGR